MKSNEQTGRKLEEVARILNAQGANPFRAQAYVDALKFAGGSFSLIPRKVLQEPAN
ncbi:hypothetical protein [Pedosphaera parvula]|uniref:Uncharacterized protein n=1 Tax=Pedosphaera parvula (strain Ellin514) TaxID=320771 RepID=B9XPU4_PEDPL|nr:hypothetical protein [Pedosphaera parvula]EEF58125.1 hypothetical protein Cflav_PD1469 [Pedosphaera parvula Ellin514]